MQRKKGKLCSVVGKSNTSATYRPFSAFDKYAMNFHLRHLNWFVNWQLKERGALTLKRVLRGGRGKFAENLCASPFKKDLSNETTFSLVHLDRQYL